MGSRRQLSLFISYTVVPALLCMGMGSCSPSVEEACNTRIPEFQKELTEAAKDVSALAPLKGRMIASVSSKSGGTEDPALLNKSFDLTSSQKNHWQSWAEKHLVETEKYLDAVRARSEMAQARTSLTALANEFVDLDVYSQRGEVYRMIASIHHAQQDVGAVNEQACHTTKNVLPGAPSTKVTTKN
jgi:hypothetical protein